MSIDPLFLQFISVYRDAYQALLKRLTEQELRGLSTFHTESLIADVEEIVQELLKYQSDWVNHAIPLRYQEGSDSAVDKLTNAYGMTDIDVSFGAVNRDAVNVIVRDTFQNVAAATTYMEDSLIEAIRHAAKEKYQLGIVTGETRRDMTKDLVSKLNQKGLTAYYDDKGRYISLKEYANTLLDENWVGFVDAAGRRWDLENYSEMLTRTKALEATNAGTENRLIQNGLDLVIITAHGAEDWCRFYENRVFSISGKSSEYPPLRDAPNHGCPFHPRCRHFEAPFLEKFESEDVIKYGKGIDNKYLGLNTEKGYADQAALRKLEVAPTSRKDGFKKHFDAEAIKGKVKLPGVPKVAYNNVIDSFSEALDHGLNTNTECLLTLDAKTGNTLYNKIGGEKSRVVFPQKLVDLIANSDDNSINIIHNHPSSSSFSIDDLKNFKFGSLSSLGVVGHNKTIYYIARREGTADFSISKLMKDYQFAQAKYFSYYQEQVISGKMTETEAWREHSHKILQYIAEENNFDYVRWLIDEQ